MYTMADWDAKLDRLLAWLASNKAYVSANVLVQNVQGSGRGLYARASIASNEQLIKIPPSLLLNFTTAVAHITSHNADVLLPGSTYAAIDVPQPKHDAVGNFYASLLLDQLLSLSSFQILAMYLMLEKTRGADSFWKPFIDTQPEVEELGFAPLVWKLLHHDSDLLWRMLPRSARKHSEKIVARYEKDVEVVSGILKDTPFFTRELFLWAWMCINSRCLYMEMPQGKDSRDNLTLAPFVDFLNHLSEDQCGIKIDPHGFQVVTSSLYSPQQELYFSYGPHSNEFLLCEYGFALPENKWNYVEVTDYIVPLLRPQHVAYLKLVGYYGDYTVNGDGMSFRTEVALATLQESDPQNSTKLAALLSGEAEGVAYGRTLNTLLNRILDKLMSDGKRWLGEKDSHTSPVEQAILSLHEDTQRICQSVRN